jgi:hypothetical protein
MTVSTWLRKHHACPEGYAWAVSSCKTMQDVWDTAKSEWLIWVATRPGVLDDITLRRFACWCARRVWHLLTDERSRHAVETAERFCDGKATLEELNTAKQSAWDAAMTSDGNATIAAARSAALSAARSGGVDTVRSLAESASRCEALALAIAPAITSDRYAEFNSAFAAQAQWLRANAKPNFED